MSVTENAAAPAQRRDQGSGAHDSATMPSDVTGRLTLFDRFATAASHFASRPWFFAACVLLVLLWAPTFLVLDSVDTWQLIINTATTIVTFLLVALLQNTQSRANDAVQQKLNALADGMADLMNHLAGEEDRSALREDMLELRKAVGLEHNEGA
jgi:low affinity Fe/Cu permease